MQNITQLNPTVVFSYFNDICSIPHGSGDVSKLADYCVNFAVNNQLKYIRDDADNVIIYKKATSTSSEPIILQGHLDMVCQKTADTTIDFEKDGLNVFIDGDYLTAKGTTLGADNGIAVAMILAILSSKTIKHPPIEAVFTSDEEIGMLGALKLDASALSSKRMINIDSEEENVVTVSCAGGSDFAVKLPIETQNRNGYSASIKISGLRGGHSGVEIDKGRLNANILLGRILNEIKFSAEFGVVSVFGGDKSNAITNASRVELLVADRNKFYDIAEQTIKTIKEEFATREPGLLIELVVNEDLISKNVLSNETCNDLLFVLGAVPNGVMEMSADIKDLVETSLNLGILRTDEKEIYIHFALRSNKMSALMALENKLNVFFGKVNCNIEVFGHYPSWEYKTNSNLRDTYIDVFTKVNGYEPKIEAIHAGLECGVFASKIEDIDCIAIGPWMYDVHTTNEKLEIASVGRIFDVLVKTLECL